MADLNDPNKPTVTDLYADVIDTLRENTKRVAAGAVPITGGAVNGPISAASFTIAPGGYPVWHAGNFTPANYMPLAGGTFTGAVSLAGNATAPLHPVTLQQLGSAGLVPEAPQDSVYYARRNGAWAPAAPRNVDEPLVGIIAARPTNINAGAGWLECSGQSASKATYARLWNWVITVGGLWLNNDADWNNNGFGHFVDLGANFRVPFLAGAFIRTIDPTGTWVPGRTPGTYQGAALLPHEHTTSGPTSGQSNDHSHQYGSDPSAAGISAYVGGGQVGAGDTSGANQDHSHSINLVSSTTGGPENRPGNVAYRHYVYAGNPLV